MDKLAAALVGCLGALFLLALALAAVAGVTILLGWLCFLIYGAIALASWPVIGLWPWVGIVFLWGVFTAPFTVRNSRTSG